MRAALRCLPFALLLTACGGGSTELAVDDAPLSVRPGTPEAAGVLDLVNDPETTFEELDVDVGLDRRAAENIVAARPFETLEALDDVPWVGPSAIDKLLAYAQAEGRVPTPTDDDALILAAVNAPDLTLERLDDDMALDARAAANIWGIRAGTDGRLGTGDDGRFASIAELDRVPWVGPRALGRILEYARRTAPAPLAPGDCRVGADCAAGLRCQGIPRDGSGDLGRCVERARVPGEGDRCGRFEPCAEGTICAGFTRFGEGYCVPQWMARRFTVEGPLALADGDAASSSVVVYGLASVPEDLTVTVRLAHDRPADLHVTLTDPNGTEAVLWSASEPLDGEYARSFVPRGISRDDEVNGRWTLTIEDRSPGAGAGELVEWSLFVVSRWD